MAKTNAQKARKNAWMNLKYRKNAAWAAEVRRKRREYQYAKYQTDPQYRAKRKAEYWWRYYAGLTGRGPKANTR